MILLLGGTTEASALAALLAGRPDLPATVSLAGRTLSPAPLPLPTRVGGFGGVDGLVAYLAREGVRAVVDATHPFAARISAHAAEACRRTGTPRLTLCRPPWRAGPGDRWTEVATMAGAVAALGQAPRRVFLTTGRLELPAFLAAPQHSYLVRSIDPPEALPPRATLVLARGPFAEDEERDLMQRHAIEVLVSKNSGGMATAGKLGAARTLGLPVVLVGPPAAPPGPDVETAAVALAWIEGLSHAGAERGV